MSSYGMTQEDRVRVMAEWIRNDMIRAVRGGVDEGCVKTLIHALESKGLEWVAKAIESEQYIEPYEEMHERIRS